MWSILNGCDKYLVGINCLCVNLLNTEKSGRGLTGLTIEAGHVKFSYILLQHTEIYLGSL